jgi:DNA-binding MarR family transcriptional regulator
MRAWRAFLVAHVRVIGRIEADLAAADAVPLTDYDVLVELWEASRHRLRLRELADAVVLSRSGITRLVDRLERDGLLRREPDPADRRGAYAVLTRAGRVAMLRAWPTYERGIERYFAAALADEEARVLAEALERVAGRASAAAEESRQVADGLGDRHPGQRARGDVAGVVGADVDAAERDHAGDREERRRPARPEAG